MKAEQIKQTLSGLDVIPTTRGILVSMSHCDTVYTGSEATCEVLNALDAHVIHSNFARLLNLTLAITNADYKFAEILSRLYTNRARFENLTEEHLRTIYKYYNKSQIDLWKQLPIYSCTNGQRISLTMQKSKMFRESYSNVQLPVAVNNIYIIKGCDRICSDLEIPLCDDVQIFKSCYIPGFSSYTEDQQVSIIDYFRRYLCNNKEILELVKRLPFVGGYRAYELYDSTDNLFTTFLPRRQFPQGIYATEEWRSTLRRLGLRYYNTMSEKERRQFLLSCCSKLAFTNRNQLSILLSRSKN
jgi:hypothetical protein